MTAENPYRAAGAFSGKAYIRRDADAQLLEQIEDNQYYPYFAAPRQSGKSSLLLRTMAALDASRYRCALVDLSPFVINSYDDFWRQFLHEIARSANFDPSPISQEDPRDVLLVWLRSCRQRLIVFLDEIDVLVSVDAREQIFSKIRTFFNLRARLDTADLQRLQFVLAGAAHSSRFIKDPRWSPFNVAIEIELGDLGPAQVSQLAAYLGTAGGFAGPDLTTRVFDQSGGSVYLCQLIFEQLWNLTARGKKRLDAADVDAVVATIVAESPRNIHFFNIYRLVTTDARLTVLFRRLSEGQELGPEEYKELCLTGICRGALPFRNPIYAQVFGPGGPLDVKVGERQIALSRALEAALTQRERLQTSHAEGQALAAAEAEIRRLRREFRDGAQLEVGSTLGRGRYRLEERVGQGGFAAVWRASDLQTGREVAVKVLHGQFAEDKTRRERFFRGAWKMSELQHPAIVTVYEPYGEEDSHFYFVMEYLPGGTLHAAVLDGEIEPALALKLIVQVGAALEYAHEHGLVHRDVKPSNVIIVGETGKLTDFDLVRETEFTGGTRTGAMGTFIYAAPEVMSRPQDADVRADIYGLGMTAVFALHGADLAMDVIRDADRFINRLPCNSVLHDVLKKAVAWDRNDRFASAAAFVHALSQATADEQGPTSASIVPALAAVVEADAPAAPAVSPELAAVDAARSLRMQRARNAPAKPDIKDAEERDAASSDADVDNAEEAPWDREIVVPGRTDTNMLRVALARSLQSSPGAAHQPTPEQAAPVTLAPPQSVESRRPHGAVWVVLAAAVLAIFIVGTIKMLPTVDDPTPDILALRSHPTKPDSGMGPVVIPLAPSRPIEDDPTDVPEDTTTTATTATSDVASTSDAIGDPPAASSTSTGSDLQIPRNPAQKPTIDQQIDDGCAQVAHGNAETGIAELLAAHDRRPTDVRMLLCIADGYEKTNRWDSAASFYARVIARSPRHIKALRGIARCNEYLNRRGIARMYYERLLQIQPSDPAAQAFMAAEQRGR